MLYWFRKRAIPFETLKKPHKYLKYALETINAEGRSGSYKFYIILPYSPHTPLATNNLFSASMSLFFVCSFALDSTHKRDHMVFVFFCLTYSLGIMPSKSIHVVPNGKISFSFMAE